ncbi:MAG: GNAT family N-acetyltransferase [Catenulispora sp.]|nr:GNAT family N-acetyltransferase [Catenulispora sp.]
MQAGAVTTIERPRQRPQTQTRIHRRRRSHPQTLGFLHLVSNDDPTCGTLIDNPHVTLSRQRTGIGRRLLTLAAEEVVNQATRPGLYLWILKQNSSAQSFHQAMGGAIVEKAAMSNTGGVPGRLVGVPTKLRCAWRDEAAVSDVART